MYKCLGVFSFCDGFGFGWFKIDEGGFKVSNGVFFDLENLFGWEIVKFVGGNKQWISIIFLGFVFGNYFICYELIVFYQVNVFQFYFECVQFVVGGFGLVQLDSFYKVVIFGYCKDGDFNIRVSCCL